MTARRGARLAVASASVALLLAVVAVASRGGFGGDAGDSTGGNYTSWALSVFLVVLLAAAPFAFYVLLVQQREVRLERRKSFVRRVLEALGGAALAVVALALLRLHLHLHLGTRPPHPTAPHAAKTGHGAHAGGAGHAAVQTHFEYPVLWVALALVAAAVVATVVLRRRQEATQEADVAAEVAAAISDALDDLEREPDARRAVIAAYARMEGVLARSGVRRDASETPLEYLRRVLAELTHRAGPAETLTRLFELAKFSTRPVGAPAKREAIDALAAIRDDLRAGVA